jgi:hypothetical protein
VYTLLVGLVALVVLFMLHKWKRRRGAPPHAKAQGDVVESIRVLLSCRKHQVGTMSLYRYATKI